MDHPYTELEKTRLWAAVESAIKDLVSNNDLVESSARPYIVGYLCQKLLNERKGVVEGMSVLAETITSDNQNDMEWNDSYFKFCNFAGFNNYVAGISSDFNWCTFTRTWWWGLFNSCSFIYCTFTDCEFEGAGFSDSRFVDCTFVDCTFQKDSIGGDCDFSDATFYGCTVKNCVGSKPDTGVDSSNAGK